MIKRLVCIAIVFIAIIGGFLFFDKFQNKADSCKKFTFWTIQLKPIYEQEINDIISNFEKKHTDYKVVWVDIPIQEAQKRTLASVLSSTPPDLINLNPDFSQILASRNALYFFNEEDVQNYQSSLVNKLRYKNKIYGLPFYATSPVTIYNKEIYDKCINDEIVRSYDELYNISEKLYNCSSVATFASSLNENDTLLKILNKYNVESFSDSEKEKTVEIYSMFNDMYKKSYLPKDVLTINHREVIEKYMSNQALVVVAGTNFINMIKQNAPDIYKKTEIAQQLVGDNKKYDVSLMNLVIPKKSKNIDLAREFAFELTSKENQLKLSKKTNVLSANKYALEDDYFKNCSNDLVDKSRCISVKQLDNLFNNEVEITNKKAINENINKALEEILLDKNTCFEFIKTSVNNLFPRLNLYILKN